jgi:hypothetical protein
MSLKYDPSFVVHDAYGMPRKTIDTTLISDDDRERFWSKVDVRGPDECWEWKRSRHPDGYGMFGLYGKGHPPIPASRLALAFKMTLLNGVLQACHSCDNPPCCNPAHLFPGTNETNRLDMINKGRRVTWRTAHGRKLEPEHVRYIREHPGERGCDLAERFGVSRATITNVRKGDTWVGLE